MRARVRVMVRVMARLMVRVIARVMVRVRFRVGGGTFAIDEVSIVGVVGDELADGGGPQRPDVALDAHAALVARLVVLPEPPVVIARARGPSVGVARAEHPIKEGDASVAKLVGGDQVIRVEAIAAHLVRVRVRIRVRVSVRVRVRVRVRVTHLREGGEEGARAALHRRLRRRVGEGHVPVHRAPVHVARARALALVRVRVGVRVRVRVG